MRQKDFWLADYWNEDHDLQTSFQDQIDLAPLSQLGTLVIIAGIWDRDGTARI